MAMLREPHTTEAFRRVHSLFLAIADYKKRLAIAQNTHFDHPGPGRKSASCATTLASAFSCAAMASACFRQGLCRGGGAGKHFFQLRGFAQKFLLLGRVQPGLGLGALRFRLGDTLPGMSGGRGGGRIGLGKGVGLKGISAMRFALSRKASTFGMVYNK